MIKPERRHQGAHNLHQLLIVKSAPLKPPGLKLLLQTPIAKRLLHNIMILLLRTNLIPLQRYILQNVTNRLALGVFINVYVFSDLVGMQGTVGYYLVDQAGLRGGQAVDYRVGKDVVVVGQVQLDVLFGFA